jgi:hypothetical protein
MNPTGPAAIDSRPPMDCADVEYKEIYMAPNMWHELAFKFGLLGQRGSDRLIVNVWPVAAVRDGVGYKM